MVRRAERFARAVLDRSHLVEQEKRVGEVEAGRRKRPPDHETGSFALAMRFDDTFDVAKRCEFAHGLFFSSGAWRCPVRTPCVRRPSTSSGGPAPASSR